MLVWRFARRFIQCCLVRLYTSSPVTAPTPPGTVPPELRALGFLLVADILAAIWCTLNWPPGMAFVVSQVPTLGAFGLLWGFLPKGRKDELGVLMSTWLQDRRVQSGLVILLAGIVVMTFTVNTVAIQGDPASPTWVYRYSGNDERHGGAVTAPRDSVRLRRGGSSQYFWMFTPPWGRTTWFESSSRISHKVHRVLPWRRTVLSYDDDFGRPIGVALLPGYGALTEGQVRYVVTGRATDDTIGTAQMPEAGGAIVLAFGRTDLAGGGTMWAAFAADSVQAAAWLTNARSAPAWRRLQLGDTIRVSAFGRAPTPLFTREVTIADSLTPLVILPDVAR